MSAWIALALAYAAVVALIFWIDREPMDRFNRIEWACVLLWPLTLLLLLGVMAWDAWQKRRARP